MCKCNIEVCWHNHCCRGKVISITCSECVVSLALVVQHAMYKCCIIFSFVACPSLPYFPTLSHKWHDFWEKLLNIKCVFCFSLQTGLKNFSF